MKRITITKKIFCLVLSLLLTLMLVSCGNKTNKSLLNKELLNENSYQILGDKTEEFKNIFNNKTLLTTNECFVIASEIDSSKYYAYSIYTGEKMFEESKYLGIETRYVHGFCYLIYKPDANTKMVYDYLGNKIIDKGEITDLEFNTYSISNDWNNSYIFMNNGGTDEYRYLETITYSVNDEEKVIASFLDIVYCDGDVDLEKSTRTPIPADYNYANDFASVINGAANKMDLAFIGYPGYYAVSSGKITNVFNDKNQLISSIKANELFYNGDSFYVSKGKMYVQEKKLVENYDDDYTVIVDGDRIKITTRSIDYITGKIEEVKVDYYLSDNSQYFSTTKKTKSGEEYRQVTYSVVQALKINDNKTLSNATTYLVIDENGKIVDESENYPIGRYYKLDDTHFIFEDENTNCSYLTDENGRIIYNMDNYYVCKEQNMIITNYNGKYGFIDYNGVVLGDGFAYSIITELANGYFYLQYNNYLFDMGVVAKINRGKIESSVDVVLGLRSSISSTYDKMVATHNFLYIYDSITKNVTIYDFDGETVLTTVNNVTNTFIIDNNGNRIHFVYHKNSDNVSCCDALYFG